MRVGIEVGGTVTDIVAVDGGRVDVEVARAGRWLLVSVSDRGAGIAAEDQGRIFERFVRAPHEGSGCGLGLAIVKSIAERHGGHVSLADVKPHGLRVMFVLPLSR